MTETEPLCPQCQGRFVENAAVISVGQGEVIHLHCQSAWQQVHGSEKKRARRRFTPRPGEGIFGAAEPDETEEEA